ncbi:IclR family transcriptional regulator [Schumannella soli]|uniref:Helix-turn-helix domain-containing protein n=1 Tax=Schumannella soli TaxID=2590779 RepID=A0A506XX82_9MICO|nr:helix-turn-helix domain-containing protein [Schumannella soli]TPW74030.1 helix-turn-helix domain-containing protein [Schumannella soli]
MPDARQDSPSQTLDRGLRMLEALADNPGLTITELASMLGLHRSIAYRMLRTHEAHGFLVRDAGGRIQLGAGLAALARSVAPDLQATAAPELSRLAEDLGMTSFLVVLDRGECVTLATASPLDAVAAVAQRPGSRHPLDRGAPGVAIQAMLTEPQWIAVGGHDGERVEASAARRLGYAFTRDEVVPGLSSVAAAFAPAGGTPVAVAVVYIGERDVTAIGARVRGAADAIARHLG